MSVMDWLWERSVLIVLGIVLIGSLVRLADHFKRTAADSRKQRLRITCPPQVARLARYATDPENAVREVQERANLDSEDFRATPEQLILTDLLQLVRALADDVDGVSSEQVELIRAFGLASGNEDFTGLSNDEVRTLVEASSENGTLHLPLLELVAATNHPDRELLCEMYIEFALLASEDDLRKLALVTGRIQKASRNDDEKREEVLQSLAELQSNLKEQLEDQSREVLGITADSSPAEIKAAYHRKVLLWHPDRLAGMAPELQEVATAKLKEINEAYEIICEGAATS